MNFTTISFPSTTFCLYRTLEELKYSTAQNTVKSVNEFVPYLGGIEITFLSQEIFLPIHRLYRTLEELKSSFVIFNPSFVLCLYRTLEELK